MHSNSILYCGMVLFTSFSECNSMYCSPGKISHLSKEVFTVGEAVRANGEVGYVILQCANSTVSDGVRYYC